MLRLQSDSHICCTALHTWIPTLIYRTFPERQSVCVCVCFILQMELICCMYLYPYVAVHKFTPPFIFSLTGLSSPSFSFTFHLSLSPSPFLLLSFSLPHLFTVPFLLCKLVCLGSCHFTFFSHLIQFDSNRKSPMNHRNTHFVIPKANTFFPLSHPFT